MYGEAGELLQVDLIQGSAARDELDAETLHRTRADILLRLSFARGTVPEILLFG
jgi:hypothetical protein